MRKLTLLEEAQSMLNTSRVWRAHAKAMPPAQRWSGRLRLAYACFLARSVISRSTPDGRRRLAARSSWAVLYAAVVAVIAVARDWPVWVVLSFAAVGFVAHGRCQYHLGWVGGYTARDDEEMAGTESSETQE